MGRRDRFEAEIRAKLAPFPPEAVAAVLDRLKAQQIVEDVRLVRRLIQANVGPKAIAIPTLRTKCADRGASEEALELFDSSPAPELGPALARFERNPKDRARAGRYLASKGFEEDAIEAALERHFGPNVAPGETYNADEA